MTRRWHRSQS